jgi:ABC-type multidrug transport system ATPase subunit
MLKRPKVLVLDEPTVGLDPDVAQGMREILKEVRKEGTAILLTSHYMKDIEELADFVYFLDAGKVVASGSVNSFRRSKNVIEITCQEPLETVHLLPGWTKTETGSLLLPDSDLGKALESLSITSIHSKEEALEEYFISVIKGNYV